jgi:hypothetical protein
MDTVLHFVTQLLRMMKESAPYAAWIRGRKSDRNTAASTDILSYLPDLPLRLRKALSMSRSACRLARSALLS